MTWKKVRKASKPFHCVYCKRYIKTGETYVRNGKNPVCLGCAYTKGIIKSDPDQES